MTVQDRLSESATTTTYKCPVCGLDSAAEGRVLGGYRLYLCPRSALRFAPQAFSVPLDYDDVYRSAEYESDQIRALQSVDGHEQARHPTYRAFFDQVPHVPGARLLDVGCGVGRFGHAAHARGWDVTGVDVSPLAIRIGLEFAPFPLRVATLEELIARGERFNVITAFEVLEHLSTPLQFMANVQRLLHPGGHLFFTVPNWSCATVQNSSRPDWLPPIHLLFFTESALRRAGELSGVVQVSTGIIRADPLPVKMLGRARWLARRLLRRPREPLGLWLHGRPRL